MVHERRRDEIAAEPHDGADAQVDVACEDDHRLADCDDGDDRDVLRDVLPVRAGQEVGRARAEEDDDPDQGEHDAELAQPERRSRELLRLHRTEARDHATASTPAAAWMTRSWVASARDSSATSRPSLMTRTRSLMPRISGSSEEMSRIVRPCVAR